MTDQISDQNVALKGLESEWFTFEGWDVLDGAAYLFTDCIFIRDIMSGPFKVYSEGAGVASVVLNYDKSTMEIYERPEHEKPTTVFEISLTIGVRIR